MKSHNKMCKTNLPDTITLTSEEMEELIKLEKMYKLADKFKRPTAKLLAHAVIIGSDSKIRETRNVGIHYFCIEFNIELLALSSNGNISKDIAILLFDKENTEFDIDKIRRALFSIPVVYNDLELFKKFFEQGFPDKTKELLVFLGPLSEYAPKNIFMFLLFKAVESEVTYSYAHAIVHRETEILEWVNEHNSTLANLPLAWILKAYGYKGNLPELKTRYLNSRYVD